MLVNLLSETKSISYVGCLAQMYFFMAFGNTDSYRLASMATDQLVAICNPFREKLRFSDNYFGEASEKEIPAKQNGLRRNKTSIPDLLLLGLSEHPEQQPLLFSTFLGMYLVTVSGNLLTILAICSDPRLHTPMYFLLANQSFIDTCFSSTIVPKVLVNIQTQHHTISHTRCLLQMYFFMALALLDDFLLAVMACDRYVAICLPLHYTTITPEDSPEPEARVVVADSDQTPGEESSASACSSCASSAGKLRAAAEDGIPQLPLDTVSIGPHEMTQPQVLEEWEGSSFSTQDSFPPHLGTARVHQYEEMKRVPCVHRITCDSESSLESKAPQGTEQAGSVGEPPAREEGSRAETPEGLVGMDSGCSSQEEADKEEQEEEGEADVEEEEEEEDVEEEEEDVEEEEKVDVEEEARVISELNGKLTSIFHEFPGISFQKEIRNQTGIPNLLLLGLSEHPEQQPLLFGTFLGMYPLTVSGNLLTILAISSDPRLHTPMYFFLANLSFINTCFSGTIVPKVLVNVQTQHHTISHTRCLLQMYFFMALALLDDFLLAVMAYDRYVAICLPLHYTTIVSPQRCLLLVTVCWLCSHLLAFPLTLLMSQFSFCASRSIPHSFSDLLPPLTLACSDTHIFQIVRLTEAALSGLVPSAASSSPMRTSCAPSSGSPLLGGSTESSLPPSSSYSADTGMVASVAYTMVTPMLNPFIYSLRTGT
ncbi:Olfactory Receptor 1N2 [Manis pentadactyla]|nr:Olfactory Receptor 1N2 [Manis pentadactyla]